MAGTALFAVNCVLPGSGLLLSRRLLTGLALLGGSLGLLSAVAIGLCERDQPAVRLAGAISLAAYPGWCALGALAWWWCCRSAVVDPARVHALYRTAATAFLTGQLEAAEVAAGQLTTLLPSEAGSWRLLELVARARGQAARATAAGHRAKRLDTLST
jgi:hypothetical protein